MPFDAIDVTHAGRARRFKARHRAPRTKETELAKKPFSDLNRALTQQPGIRFFIFFTNASKPTRYLDLNMATRPICEGLAHKLSLPVTFATVRHDLVPHRPLSVQVNDPGRSD